MFVSVPFTTYTMLAGLQSDPRPRCTRRRGSTARRTLRTYFSITLPLLRPALLVAALINVMNVFNSFPIIWEMTHGGPGYDTATTHRLHVHPQGRHIGESAAMSVVNFALDDRDRRCCSCRSSKWNKEEA